ncbi:MAG: hypothetical protein AB7I50_09985 [Vicinamibacterales bacterium]
MSDFANLKNTLKQGALITAANWPVILVQFIAESTFKLLLGVPVVGGVLLVALALGRDVQDLLRGSVRDVVGNVAGALLDHPAAFGAFLASAAVVIIGGSMLMFMIKAGTVTILVEGARRGTGIERSPLRVATLRRATVFSILRFSTACDRLFRRFVRLGGVLLAIYAGSAAVFLLMLVTAYQLSQTSTSIIGWTLTGALLSSVLVVWITVVNLFYLLTQMVVAAEDCAVRDGVRQVATFVRLEFRSVSLVFVLVLTFVMLATMASMLATAGLGLVSFVPLVGVAVLPLQAAAWLVRGVVFQYLGLSALSAYASLYHAADGCLSSRRDWRRTAS